ncbi:MAG: flagellar biosynthesis protein FlhA [Maricaulis sp.]|uniref:flagellar biosynthesis protein FlhA n=1 Tax=Maricaulis sp. TaxID=1486257 RepID=UPI001B1BA94A|nr:flagellar biosynthesis protein FlhA [Maricaulis sp.]MBO6729436.1 flagellar biosynthesis protein FlhA [Maricaulis sp.]MBO6847950.1 flagellar biosynthesis protein FlhA [Maricaulis sp.]MBO6877672.1 flagellar biosynthesis protein FlhA [Maricaulis sp.]
MADTAGTNQTPSAGGFNLQAFLNRTLRGDVALAVGILGILVMLLLPMPSLLLDLSLATSISIAVLVLMTALFIKKPLEFSAFPAVLLITTLLRLGLNIASTRLILSRGHEGTDAAGEVIEAFGAFVMQGNVVIGVIVFAILVIVNFVVITKGSGRIAEVAARFTLDSMPGKQMAIDADLSAGLITEHEAKERRKELEGESNFYGAMDGASKFVRGDAMAGLMITAINLIGGIIIGVVQSGMPFADAAAAYSTLTIGDGLVSQIPALIISVAAGLLVSKAGVDGEADKAVFGQLTANPQGLGLVSGVALIVGVLPGMPFIPFAMMSAGAGALAWMNRDIQERKAAEKEAARIAAEAPQEEEVAPEDAPIEDSLTIDELKIELGYGLLPLINDVDGRKLTDQIKALRRSLAEEMGFVTPAVRIIDNMQLGNQEYSIRVKELEAGKGDLELNKLLVMDPAGLPIDMAGDHVKEPAFGLPATWIEENLREEASFRGYTIVEPAAVMVTHLTEILRENMADLLSYAEVEKLIDKLSKEHKKLVEDIAPAQISRAGIQRVLQTLIKERISIRDLPTILEGIAEASATTQNLDAIVEHVRTRLSRQICHSNRAPDGNLPVMALSPHWEQAFMEALVGDGERKQLALAPSKLHDFVAAVRNSFETASAQGQVPVLLTSPLIRPYVRSLVERFRPQTVVMSQNEIHPSARLQTLGHVG